MKPNIFIVFAFLLAGGCQTVGDSLNEGQDSVNNYFDKPIQVSYAEEEPKDCEFVKDLEGRSGYSETTAKTVLKTFAKKAKADTVYVTDVEQRDGEYHSTGKAYRCKKMQ